MSPKEATVLKNKLLSGLSWLSGLLAVYFAVNGVLKLASHPRMVENFEKWGYTRAFMFRIGVMELAAGAALLVNRSASRAALVPIGVMIGAFGTAEIIRRRAVGVGADAEASRPHPTA